LLAAMIEDALFCPAECRYLGEREFLEALKAGFDRGYGGATRADLDGGDPAKIPLLLFDDIGASRLTEWGRGEVAGLLEDRHGAERPTIITSNLSLDDLARFVDARLASRIAESGHVLGFPARDLRIQGRVGREPAQQGEEA